MMSQISKQMVIAVWEGTRTFAWVGSKRNKQNSLGHILLWRSDVAKNSKARLFYVLYSDKTWVFDQSERATGPMIF